MSDQFGGPSVPPGAGAGQGQPSEEEIRAYLAQLREADVSEIVAQAFNMLASAAQVKLGRADGRLLINLAGAMTEAAADGIDAGLHEQMNDAVHQLRMAQVEAEKETGQASEAASTPEGAETAQQPSGGQTQEGPGTSSAASKLWTPGR